MTKGTVVEGPLDCDDELVDKVLTAATQVHRTFGPGLLESVYERALVVELDAMGISSKRQVHVSVSYRGQELGTGFKADVVVEDKLLLELKCVDDFSSVHLAQILTYLKLLSIKRGYLLNFNTKLLKYGIRRVSI